MNAFFKVFIRGLIVTLLLPLILAFLLIYSVYCAIVYIIMLFRNTIVFFAGGSITDLKADIEAKNVLKKKKNIKNDMTQVLADLMHSAIEQNPEAVQAMAQQEIATKRKGVNEKDAEPVKEIPVSDVKDIEGEDK